MFDTKNINLMVRIDTFSQWFSSMVQFGSIQFGFNLRIVASLVHTLLYFLSHHRFVSDWVYNGVFRDVYGEFMIQVNEEYLNFRGEIHRHNMTSDGRL